MFRKSNPGVLHSAWLLFVLVVATENSMSTPAAEKVSPEVSSDEARVLAYLVPEVRALVARGIAVRCYEDVYNPSLNRVDYYFFVFMMPEDPDTASNLVGRFAVAKRTGDVWSFVDKEPLKDPVLDEVVGVVRAARGISPETVLHYRTKSIFAE